MVLRALLEKCRGELGIFGRCARRIGFAEELSDQLREFQQLGLSPDRVRQMAGEFTGVLAQKLLDLACLFETYRGWLAANGTEDADSLLCAATEHLRENPGKLRIDALWFDGFAQLTPEERRLLVELIGRCERATLAFCMESEGRTGSPLSPWYLVSETWVRCRTELQSRYGQGSVRTELLERNAARSRFSESLALARLERCWARPRENDTPSAEERAALDAVAIRKCADPEAEAICCAREILRFVRTGGRFREVAILVRSFENEYPQVLPRVMRKYGIPFFLDHRENVAHHPLAELTRGVLRTLAFGWKHTDLFTALKSGLTHTPMDVLDELENEALANGWEGDHWKNGFRFRSDSKREGYLELLNRRREALVTPLRRLEKQFGGTPSGTELAETLRGYWDRLQVREQLEGWSREPAEAFHETVWEQMNLWLENVQLAFGQHHLPLREWLPILEAGLSGLSVGVIPPVLDQVLIGAIDRSRNPDLRLAFVLGANEGVFPAVPARDQLLTEDDRHLLLNLGCEIARIPALQIAQEQFYGYIACTRARERLIVTYSTATLDGTPLNRSRFVQHLQQIFPQLNEVAWSHPAKLEDVEHASELFRFVSMWKADLGETGSLSQWREKINALRTPDPNELLAGEMAQRLYGPNLEMGVSSMERFGACPYRFFLGQGLKVQERTEFELDIREQGRFQHEILLRFHEEVRRKKKEWRDLTKEQAVTLVNAIADEQIEQFGGGLFAGNRQNRFIGENYKRALARFISAVIDWFGSNSFDPTEVELPFGYDGPLPGWRLPLENGNTLVFRGRIDRVDLFRSGPRTALCVVLDYKSGMRKPDPLLMQHGIEQQLPGYLLALTQIEEVKARFGLEEIIAAGCFLVPLRISFETSKNRTEALEGGREEIAFKHFGFFDQTHLEALDNKHDEDGSGQFHYAINQDGTPNRQGFHAVESAEFKRILSNTERLLKSFGKRIYEGDISIRPFKKGGKTGCDQCHFRPICRFDPWVQEYNVIRKPAPAKQSNKRGER